jgi:hypothetical protein
MKRDSPVPNHKETTSSATLRIAYSPSFEMVATLSRVENGCHFYKTIFIAVIYSRMCFSSFGNFLKFWANLSNPMKMATLVQGCGSTYTRVLADKSIRCKVARVAICRRFDKFSRIFKKLPNHLKHILQYITATKKVIVKVATIINSGSHLKNER